MFASLSLSRVVSRLAHIGVAFFAVAAGVASAQVTTITGKVYSPLGPTGGDPIPNILVYVAQTAVQPFTPGISNPGQGCSAQANLVSGSPLVEALTAADGSFTLTSTSMPNPVNIVIQAGKWRRQYQNTPVVIGGTTTLNLTMPANQSQGDLPRIAVVTGAADAIECIFPQIGISASEFTDPSGSGSINLYKGDGGNGVDYGASVSSATPTEAALVENAATLNSYDLVMFGCRGTGSDAIVTADAGNTMENLLAYTSSGGRMFTTHYGYVWINNAKTFPGVANWITDKGTITEAGFPANSGEGTATINPNFSEGATLSQWLQDIGASYGGVQGQVYLTNMRQDENGAISPPSDIWATANGISGSPSMQFTFDTPIGAASTPTVAIAYSNSTTVFQPGDTADSITINVTNNGTANTLANLSLSVTLPSVLTATSLTDPTGGWICTIGVPTSTCTRTTPLLAGTTDNVTLTFSIASTASIGSASITASLSGGGLSDSGQCGRVLYNDYHVETPKNATAIFPGECPTQTGLSNEQKFLEFSLYNLSNFISPSTTDIITIQGTPIITWPMPAPMPYGVPLSATQLDATAMYGGSAVAGTFVYSPPAGTILPLGPNTLAVTFTPTNSTLYLSASGTTTVQVVADTTTVTLTSGTDPSYLGQSVTFSAAVGSNGAIAAGQTVNFFDGLTQIGTGVTNAQGVATYTTSALIVGSHSMTACVVASPDFNASCSTSLIQLVTLIPTPPLTTSSVLTSNANPSFLTQNVTFTVGVATTGAFTTVPTGTVTFYDGTTALGTGTLNATGFATFSTSTLTLGTHTITAVYGGSATMATSTSNVVLQLVLTSLPSAGSGYLLTVDPINVSLAVGTSQVVNVSVLSLNNFQQTVTLSCTGNFPNNGCALGKTLMPVGGGVTTLTLTALAPSACGASSGYFTAKNDLGGKMPLLALGGLGLGMLWARRRRRTRQLMQGLTLALAFCVLPLLGGCGGKCTDLGTQPGSYTLKVTAVSSGSSPITQTQEIVVNVHL
jgi:uncharacterized protein (TIGR03382 family)